MKDSHVLLRCHSRFGRRRKERYTRSGFTPCTRMDLPVLADGEYPIGHAAVEVRSRCLTPKDLAAMQQPRARVLREGRPVQGPTNLQSRFPNDGFSALSSGYQMSQRGLATKKYRTVGQYRTPGRLSHRSDQRTTRPHIADRHTHQVLGERTTQSYRPARPGG